MNTLKMVVIRHLAIRGDVPEILTIMIARLGNSTLQTSHSETKFNILSS